MIALQILDVKSFMSNLLIKKTFDNFYLYELEISTYNNFKINGKLNEDFFTEEELLSFNERSYSFWSEIKPLAYQLIKGTKTPLGFRLIFQLSNDNTLKLLSSNELNFNPTEIRGLYLNIRYEHNKLSCVTGTNFNTFVVDKSLEIEWDNSVKKFFKLNEIAFE